MFIFSKKGKEEEKKERVGSCTYASIQQPYQTDILYFLHDKNGWLYCKISSPTC